MAKKITKRSRAARRGEINIEDPQVKSLETLPRAENTNVANSIIRTAAKNEDLLNLKLNKKKKSLPNGAVSKVTKEKKSRFEKIDGRLSSKLERSLERSRIVKAQRKLGWESVNQRIKDELLKGNIKEEELNRKLDEKLAEDLEIADFFKDEKESEKASNVPQNMFEMLGEEVA